MVHSCGPGRFQRAAALSRPGSESSRLLWLTPGLFSQSRLTTRQELPSSIGRQGDGLDEGCRCREGFLAVRISGKVVQQIQSHTAQRTAVYSWRSREISRGREVVAARRGRTVSTAVVQKEASCAPIGTLRLRLSAAHGPHQRGGDHERIINIIHEACNSLPNKTRQHLRRHVTSSGEGTRSGSHLVESLST